MEIKSKGTQAFNVPLDDEGKSFIQHCRKYAHNITIKPRGRSLKAEVKNRGSYWRSIPLGLSNWAALYVNRPMDDDRHMHDRDRVYELEGENTKLDERNHELANECDKLLKRLKARPTEHSSTLRFNSEKFLLRQVLVKCHDGHVWYAGLKVQFPNDLREEGRVFKCDLCEACDSLGKLKFYRVVLGTMWKQEVETTKVWKYAQ